MRKLLVAGVLAALAPAVQAVTIACDADPRSTHSAIQFCTTLDTTTTPATCKTWGSFGPDVPVIAGAPFDTCNHDVSSVAAGTHIVRIKAVQTDAAWGRVESPPSAPFAFERPGALVAPAGIRLIP